MEKSGLIQMPSSPPNDFSRRLTEDITWRIRELSSFKRSIGLSSKLESRALLRASVPLLYAHWEGFFSTSTTVFLNHISQRRYSIDDLRPEFWALLKMKTYTPDKIQSEIQFFRMLIDVRTEPKKPFRRGRHIDISASSNLKFEVLCRGCEFLGISTDGFEEYKYFIDECLLPDRNYIAHGEYRAIDIDKFEDYRNNVLDLMRITKNKLENVVIDESFKISDRRLGNSTLLDASA